MNVIKRFLLLKYPRCWRTADNSIWCTQPPPPPALFAYNHMAWQCVCVCVCEYFGWKRNGNWENEMESSTAVDLCFYLVCSCCSSPTFFSYFVRFFSCFLVSYQASLCSPEERRATVIETESKTLMCIVFNADRGAYSLSLKASKFTLRSWANTTDIVAKLTKRSANERSLSQVSGL